ncbi:MAG: hypothetical protein A3F46_06905 [Legionellales bacterium RIFCSPHIGHO2_12_FULL_42_9]|nr:MAG: hypothetical protein A3F46_06905 [Legionellales bacterium RIFCSPHIGHO2_12_FULL_42_9]
MDVFKEEQFSSVHWLFCVSVEISRHKFQILGSQETRLYDFFKNAHNTNDVAKIQAKNLRNTDESRYPFTQLVDPVVKPQYTARSIHLLWTMDTAVDAVVIRP